MSASFGAVLILLTLLRFFVRKKTIRQKILPLADRLLFLGCFCLFLSSSLFPIKFWWILKFIGYPARILYFSVIFFAIAIAIVMHIGLKGKLLRSVALYSLIAVSILVGLAEADARNVSYISFQQRLLKTTRTERIL